MNCHSQENAQGLLWGRISHAVSKLVSRPPTAERLNDHFNLSALGWPLRSAQALVLFSAVGPRVRIASRVVTVTRSSPPGGVGALSLIHI